MLENGQRFCDLCKEIFLKGTKYEHIRMASQDAGILMAGKDLDMAPTWKPNREGTIRECVLDGN
jgi:hypothetical protein